MSEMKLKLEQMKESVNIELMKSVENETLRKRIDQMKTDFMIEREKFN